MKVTLVFVALVAAAALVSATAPEEYEHRFLFSKFRAQHGKVYHPEEVEYRFKVFRQNFEHIKKHQEEYAQGLHTHKLTMNEFGDLTNEEFTRMMKGYRYTGFSTPNSTFVHDGSDLPTSVDWRQKGAVTPVKNQGQCGSCWSFSASGAIEGANQIKTGNLVSVSEQEFVDCVNGGADTCQTGGEMDQAFEFAIKKGGVETEESYPYCACSGNQCQFNPSKIAVTSITGYSDVKQGDEAGVIAALANHGPVSVAVNAAGMSWQFYGGGIMSGSCPNSPSDLDHGVLAVGYTANSVIIKNSWGASWGEQGYVQLPRGQDYCGFAQDASYPTTN